MRASPARASPAGPETCPPRAARCAAKSALSSVENSTEPAGPSDGAPPSRMARTRHAARAAPAAPGAASIGEGGASGSAVGLAAASMRRPVPTAPQTSRGATAARRRALGLLGRPSRHVAAHVSRRQVIPCIDTWLPRGCPTRGRPARLRGTREALPLERLRGSSGGQERGAREGGKRGGQERHAGPAPGPALAPLKHISGAGLPSGTIKGVSSRVAPLVHPARLASALTLAGSPPG